MMDQELNIGRVHFDWNPISINRAVRFLRFHTYIEDVIEMERLRIKQSFKLALENSHKTNMQEQAEENRQADILEEASDEQSYSKASHDGSSNFDQDIFEDAALEFREESEPIEDNQEEEVQQANVLGDKDQRELRKQKTILTNSQKDSALKDFASHKATT